MVIPATDLGPEDLGRRLASLHEDLRTLYPALCRIAVAVYDADSDLLKTFVHSTEGGSPLRLYQATLGTVPSLKSIADANRPRVIDDLGTLANTGREHTQAIRDAQYRSSYTLPIRQHGRLFGFLFFNALEPGFFSPTVIRTLDIYTQLVSLLVINELVPLVTLKGAVRAAREFSRHRDEETGDHLERMSRYAHLIGLTLARDFDLPDWYVEYLFHFAPLHDVGKVAVPDAILLKPARLTEGEYEVMKSHVERGVSIIDAMMEGFGLHGIQHAEMLRNIVAYHHESVDGSGYPHGLAGEDIPLEARITAVADVFDALTSRRPYKDAWSFDEAIDYLIRYAGVRYDPRCVEALVAGRHEIARIQAQFREDPLG